MSVQIPAGERGRVSGERPQRPSLWSSRTRWLLLLVIALLWSMAQAGLFSGDLVNGGGWPQFAAFWRAAFQPVLTPQFLAITLQATLVTLAYAVLGTVLSLLIGCLLGLLTSEVWWESVWPRRPRARRAPWAGIRGLLAVPRGIHELLWGLFFLNILGLDPLVAILAIAIPYGAIVAKVFAEILDETDRGPYLALLNSGATPLKAVLYALAPAALADLLSYAFYRFECAIRAAAVLGIVGAGGIGFQILLSMQTLNYNETWTLFYALMLLSGLADAWSAQVRRRLGRTTIAGQEFGESTESRLPAAASVDRVLRGSLLAVAVLIPLSLWFVNPTWSLLWSPRTAQQLAFIAGQAWPLKLTWEELRILFQLSLATLAMSILAATLATSGGSFLSFPAARTFGTANEGSSTAGRRLLIDGARWLARALLLLMRAVPAPVWALVLLFLFFPGMLPGALALAIYNMGVLGRLMAEVTENQDDRPLQAIRATGAGSGAAALYGILPAISPRYLAYGLYRWENIIRETLIVGLVGAGGLGRAMNQQLSAFNYRAVLALLICMVLITFGVDMVSSAARRALR